MTQATVIEAKKTDSGIIHHQLSDGSRKEWAAIRAGVSLPTEEANGYFIIFGEEWTGGGTVYEGQKPRRGRLQILAEQQIESPFLRDTLRPFTDACSMFGCAYAYAGFDDNNPAETDQQVQLAQEWIYDEGLRIRLYSAPYHKKFKVGVDLIHSFLDKALLILPEKSLVAQQLAGLSQHDLLEKPETRFVAVNGLRFVIGSFHKSPPTIGSFSPKRQRRSLHLPRPRFY